MIKYFNNIFFASLSTFFLSLVGCANPEMPPPEVPILEDFSCVKLVDDQGQDLGFYGCLSSNDWTNIELSDTEAAYFLANDIIPLTGTTAANITAVAVYPNPVVQGSSFSFRKRTSTNQSAPRRKRRHQHCSSAR
jgi:hypothetical protein